jgi:hypothetical protein
MLERRNGLDVPPGVEKVRDRIAFRRKTDDLSITLLRVNRWWDTLCKQLRLNPNAPIWQDFGSHVAELVMNARVVANIVSVYCISSESMIGIVVEDNGPGWEDPPKDAWLNERHGLQRAISFADQVVIESCGRRYENMVTAPALAYSGTVTAPGTRVAIMKKRSGRPSH